MSTAAFEDIEPGTGRGQQKAHPANIEHSQRLLRKLYAVGDKAWSMVGNGLSNQTFIEAPEGLIVIDTGECVEEMQSALREVRRYTQAPVVACLYTHFHYVNGTTALLAEMAADNKILGQFDLVGIPPAPRGVPQIGTQAPILACCGRAAFSRCPRNHPSRSRRKAKASLSGAQSGNDRLTRPSARETRKLKRVARAEGLSEISTGGSPGRTWVEGRFFVTGWTVLSKRRQQPSIRGLQHHATMAEDRIQRYRRLL